MDQLIEKNYDAEKANEMFYEQLEEFKKHISNDGSATIEHRPGQWSLNLGFEQNIDNILPVSKQELEWRLES